MTRRSDIPPIFVCADTAAALCEISRDTWDTWVKLNKAPAPCVREGQTIRWHWPSVEAALASGGRSGVECDPSVAGALNVGKKGARNVAA